MHLIILSMIDNSLTLGIDWLSTRRVVLGYYTKIVTLAMLRIPLVMW